MVLVQRLRDALVRLNPELPAEVLEDAFRKLSRPDLPADQAGGADLMRRNRALHRLLVDGVTVEYRDAEGAVRGAQATDAESAHTAPASPVDNQPNQEVAISRRLNWQSAESRGYNQPQ